MSCNVQKLAKCNCAAVALESCLESCSGVKDTQRMIKCEELCKESFAEDKKERETNRRGGNSSSSSGGGTDKKHVMDKGRNLKRFNGKSST